VPSFVAVVGGVILLGAPGVVLGPLVVSLSLSLMEIWKARNLQRVEERSGTGGRFDLPQAGKDATHY